jgi:ectoine hydroxylase-related dioxygenase (phytanoyl-CoA dioxygenase family)
MNWYGVREGTVSETALARHVEEVRIVGYTIVPQLVDAETLEVIRGRLDDAYRRQADEVGGEERLQAIADGNIVRCLLSADQYFLDLATHPRILGLLRELLGEYYILQQQNGVINPPARQHHQSSWHRDLPYQHFVSSRPLAISALWCIDAFNERTGGTCVLPASHKYEPAPSETYVNSHAHGIVAAAGDALVFDCMLFHRAGNNRSDCPRRAVNHVYALPFLKQQINLPSALSGHLSDDPFLRRFLGFDSHPAASALEWRQSRLRSSAA